MPSLGKKRIYFCSPRLAAPSDALVINVTSRATNTFVHLSPFLLGPVDLYGYYKSLKMENAWQYSKVYEGYINARGWPSFDYFAWAEAGWNDPRANRYPMGKGAVPLYSYWDGRKLSYIQARREIYIPLYSKCVVLTEAWQELKKLYKTEKKIALWDFDVYEPCSWGWDDVINCPHKKMGHGFVLAMMLQGFINA